MIKSNKKKKGDYTITKNNKKIGKIFRTGFGGNIEWTLIDIKGQSSSGHRTKKSALNQMKSIYGKKGRGKNENKIKRNYK